VHADSRARLLVGDSGQPHLQSEGLPIVVSGQFFHKYFYFYYCSERVL
jgi:hypothetical protein